MKNLNLIEMSHLNETFSESEWQEGDSQVDSEYAEYCRANDIPVYNYDQVQSDISQSQSQYNNQQQQQQYQQYQQSDISQTQSQYNNQQQQQSQEQQSEISQTESKYSQHSKPKSDISISAIGDHKEFAELKQPDPKNFRLQNHRYIITYRTHIDKIDLIAHIETVAKIKKEKMKFIRVAHESGHNDPIVPYEHTHVLVDFGKVFSSKDQHIFDYKDIHPNIKFTVTKRHWEIQKRYIAKEDPQNEDLLEDASMVMGVANSLSLKDAYVNYVRKFGDVMGVKTIYESLSSDIEREPPNIQLREWQEEIIKRFNQPVDRSVVWITDIKGGCGKSTFLDWMELSYPDKVCGLVQLGGTQNSATIIKNHIDKYPKTEIIIIDLPRDAQKRNIYDSIESFKNGKMNTTKYSGKTFRFNKCHVCVLANFYPDLSRLTLNRWYDSLYVVDDQGEMRVISNETIDQAYEVDELRNKMNVEEMALASHPVRVKFKLKVLGSTPIFERQPVRE